VQGKGSLAIINLKSARLLPNVNLSLPEKMKTPMSVPVEKK
jgi:hypothetical protein